MGNGLFAVRDISRGTRIVAEIPILAIDKASSNEDDLPLFCAALQHLSKAELRNLDKLYHLDTHDATAVRQQVRQWYRDQGTTDKSGNIIKGKKLQDFAKSTVKRFGIFLANRVEMGVGGAYGSGIFPLYSRVNHSCVPNIHNSYNPNIQRLTTYALRDIAAGEQIFTSYLDSACRTGQQRRQMTLDMWGFVCACHACTDESSEPLRQRMFEIDQRLGAWETPELRRINSNLTRFGSGLMPGTALEALKDAEELAQLLKMQGLEGMELCKAYVPQSLHMVSCLLFHLSQRLTNRLQVSRLFQVQP